jgi:hypothetical protein
MIRTAKFGAVVAAMAFASACSTTTSGTTSGTGTGTGTTSGTGTGASTSGSSGTTSGTTIYCNGLELTDSSAATIFMATYPKSDDIRVNCDHAFDPYEIDAGSGSSATYFQLAELAGVLDRNTNAPQGTLYSVWPAGCDDLDAGPGPTGGTVVVDGGTTIAATLVAGNSGSATTFAGPIYGVVTFVTAPYTSDTGAHSGSMWIQDPVAAGSTPAPNSGVEVYFPSESANDAGATQAGLYPPISVVRGDVVAFTNLKWDPYAAKTDIGGAAQNELEFVATATMSLVGQGTLPPPVPLTGAELTADGGMFMGMRVVQTDGPDTVTNTCPVALQSSSSD